MTEAVENAIYTLAEYLIHNGYQTKEQLVEQWGISFGKLEERKTKLLSSWDKHQMVQEYLNDPARQDIIDKPQEHDPTKPVHMPKHLLKSASSGKVIGYWKHDKDYYENGKRVGYLPPVFLPPLERDQEWKFDIVSGKFYIV